MKSRLSARILAFYAVAAISGLSGGSLLADTVKTKDGKTLEGKITYEGTDFIKFEVAVSATIKDTKTIPRTEIVEIIKAAPDDVALDALRKQLPAPSLMSAEAYRTMIEKGPKAFLTQFPSSAHKPEVEKILADLTDELDKVERGSVKLEGEWISAQDRKQFEALTNSRIRLVVMRQNIAQRNLLGALRDFEILEEQYYGTPAFATALGEVRQVLPAFGGFVQQSLASVKLRNEQWEKDKGVLDEVARKQVEAARAAELANFKRANDQEKAAGVKWMTVNNNSAESLTATLNLVKAEIDRLGKIDVNEMTQLGEKLVAVDKLIAEGKLAEAKQGLAEATGTKVSSSKSSSSSSKSGSKSKTTYIIALTSKIKETEGSIAEAKKQAEIAAQGDKTASAIKGGDAPPLVSATVGDGTAAEGTAAAADQASALTGLMAAGGDSKGGDKGKADEASKKAPAKKTTASSSKKKAASTDDDDEDEDKPARNAPVDSDDEEGGLSVTNYIQIGAGVLVLVVVVMKLLGVGGKKKEE
ncbi:MAG: hypothetical protein KDM63_02175 [Verrucomicrobiae bacterium]|nr:hypothetical protein [Verrucomicrobiae bacterium]